MSDTIPFDKNASTEELNRQVDALTNEKKRLTTSYNQQAARLDTAIKERTDVVTRRWQEKGESPAPAPVYYPFGAED